MAEIFISYSRRDSAFVHTLQEALHSAARETWVDWQDIPPTAEWLAEIHAAIEAADTFVFVISPDAIASHVCGLELTHAVEQHKRLVPIVRRDVTPADAPEAIAKLNWIFFRESDDFAPSLKTLLEAIDLDLARARTHTRLLTRALEWERRNCDGSLLLRGRDLHEAEDVLALTSAERTPQPTDLQRAYVLASRHAARRTQRVALTAVCAAAAVLAVLAVLAWLQRNEAVREQLIASSRELASYSSQQLHANPELSLLLAVQAALSSDGKLLALSPDGKWIVLAGGPGTARIWGAGSGNEVEVLGGESVGGLDAAFSPDDRWAGTADWNTGPVLYECLVCSPLNDLLSLAGSRAKRGFTPEEHSRYLHQGLGAYRLPAPSGANEEAITMKPSRRFFLLMSALLVCACWFARPDSTPRLFAQTTGSGGGPTLTGGVSAGCDPTTDPACGSAQNGGAGNAGAAGISFCGNLPVAANGTECSDYPCGPQPDDPNQIQQWLACYSAYTQGPSPCDNPYEVNIGTSSLYNLCVPVGVSGATLTGGVATTCDASADPNCALPTAQNADCPSSVPGCSTAPGVNQTMNCSYPTDTACGSTPPGPTNQNGQTGCSANGSTASSCVPARVSQVQGDQNFQNLVADCFGQLRRAAAAGGPSAQPIRDLLQFLDTQPGGSGSPQNSLTIVSSANPFQDPETLPNGRNDPASLQQVTAGVPVNSVITINGSVGEWLLAWTGAPVPPNFCTVLVHELSHAADMMSGSTPAGTCQLDGGSLPATEVKAMAVTNSFLKSAGQNAVPAYGPIYLPDDALTPSAASWQRYQQGQICP